MTKFPERSLQVLHCDEPSLEFGSRQTTPHPKDGLFLYGPHAKSKKTEGIRIGVVGTAAGINLFRSWAAQIKRRVEVPPPGKAEKKDRLHLANFPGIEETFCISFNENELAACTLDYKDIDSASRILNLHEATAKVVKVYVDRIRRHISNGITASAPKNRAGQASAWRRSRPPCRITSTAGHGSWWANSPRWRAGARPSGPSWRRR